MIDWKGEYEAEHEKRIALMKLLAEEKHKSARLEAALTCGHYFESWNDTCRYCGAVKPDAFTLGKEVKS